MTFKSGYNFWKSNWKWEAADKEFESWKFNLKQVLWPAAKKSTKKNKEKSSSHSLALTITTQKEVQIPELLQFTNFAPNLPIFSFSDGLMERSERSARPQANSSPYDFYGKPFYGKTTTDVIVQEGSHAFFHCLVHNLGNQTVSLFFISQQHSGRGGN